MNEEPTPGVRQPTEKPGVGETLSAALGLMREYPRETMLPLLTLQVPLVLGTILLTVVLYGTVFANEMYPEGGILAATQRGGQVFALVVVVAVGAVVGVIAQGATILSVAGVALGRPLTLTEALDPAFTRLGGLIALTVIFAVVGGLLAFTIVGLAVIPFLIARFGIAYQVYLLEELGPIDALRQSWSTMNGNMLRLLGILLVGLALLLLIGLLVPVSPGPESMSRSARIAIDALLQILQGGAAIPVTVFAHAAVTLYYLRIREESS